MDKIAQLEKRFADLSIDYSKPEFYNNPKFVAHEQRNPEFLWEYTDYVVSREYPAEYVEKAEIAVPKIVGYLYEELVKDGRLGACLDVSLAASKILEKYGFWNTIQTGSFTAELPDAPRRKIRHWPEFMVPGEKSKVGHAWLVAPPFKHIDLAVSRQEQNEDMRPFVSPYVIAKEIGGVEGVSFDDMVDPDLKNLWLRQTGTLPSIQDIMKHNENVARYMTRFRPFSVKDGRSMLKYFPCRPTAALEKFEDHTGHCFSGRRTPKVFSDMIAAIGSPEEIGYGPNLKA
jgi:hypothetical protein